MFIKDKYHWYHLKFMLTLARAGTFAKAAKEMQVDPFTVRSWLDAWESNGGKRLFHRNRQGLQLTDHGRMMYNFFEEVEKGIVEPMGWPWNQEELPPPWRH